MNKVMLIGRLTKDPEIRATQSGKRVASFTIAVNRRKREDPADFIQCQAWEKTADIVEKYCPKGKQVAIFGRIQTGSYENKEGRKVYTTDIIVDELELLGSKSDAPAQEAPKPQPKPDDNPYMDETPGFKQLDLDSLDDELPFI